MTYALMGRQRDLLPARSGPRGAARLVARRKHDHVAALHAVLRELVAVATVTRLRGGGCRARRRYSSRRLVTVAHVRPCRLGRPRLAHREPQDGAASKLLARARAAVFFHSQTLSFASQRMSNAEHQ